MPLKEAVRTILRTSPFWSIGVSAIISIIAANEGAKGEKPIKTVLAILVYLSIIALLVFYIAVS